MYTWGVADYLSERSANNVTCAEYVEALIKRMLFYKDLNCFVATQYEDSSQQDLVRGWAAALDRKAAADGVEAIAPLYGLPIAIKGTMLTKDLYSCNGTGKFKYHKADEDAGIVQLIHAKYGIPFFKTNVSEFASSVGIYDAAE